MVSLTGKHKAPNSSRARCSFLGKFNSALSLERGGESSFAERRGGEGIPRTATSIRKSTEGGRSLGDYSEKFLMNDDGGMTDETGGASSQIMKGLGCHTNGSGRGPEDTECQSTSHRKGT